MTIVVGVDGGGTRTRAVVLDESGRELGRAVGVGAVVVPGAVGPAVGAVEGAVRTAAERAGVELPVQRLWAGLAGAGSRRAREEAERALAGSGLAERLVVGTDVEAAFHHAFPSGPGLLLIAGTGSIAWGRSERGEMVRVGGWGDRLGDEGSGYAIGLGALRGVVRALDGRGDATTLAQAVSAGLGVDTPDEVMEWCATASKGEVAALVPVVVDAAQAGDGVAEGVLAEAVTHLDLHVRTLVRRGGPWSDPPELVLWGGLLQEGGPLRPVVEAAAAVHPVRVVQRQPDAALGAAHLALLGAATGD